MTIIEFPVFVRFIPDVEISINHFLPCHYNGYNKRPTFISIGDISLYNNFFLVYAIKIKN